MPDQPPARSERPADYIVIRDGQIVQEISALGAANAKAAKTEAGTLYARCGDDDHYAGEVNAFIGEALGR
jgi:hypothetical protein